MSSISSARKTLYSLKPFRYKPSTLDRFLSSISLFCEFRRCLSHQDAINLGFSQGLCQVRPHHMYTVVIFSTNTIRIDNLALPHNPFTAGKNQTQSTVHELSRSTKPAHTTLKMPPTGQASLPGAKMAMSTPVWGTPPTRSLKPAWPC